MTAAAAATALAPLALIRFVWAVAAAAAAAAAQHDAEIDAVVADQYAEVLSAAVVGLMFYRPTVVVAAVAVAVAVTWPVAVGKEVARAPYSYRRFPHCK